MGGPSVAGMVGRERCFSLVDGLVWAELGAAMPRAGGTYAFLREAYGPRRGGRLMSFLYIWQTLIQARSSSRQARLVSRNTSRTGPARQVQQKAVSAALVVFLIVPALPQDRGRRPDLEVSLDRRGRHDVCGYLGRGDALLRTDGV